MKYLVIFENQIRESLEKLQYNYFIKIHLFNEDFDITKFEVEIIINELKSWLKSSSKIVGDKVIICDLFVFEIIKVNTNINRYAQLVLQNQLTTNHKNLNK